MKIWMVVLVALVLGLTGCFVVRGRHGERLLITPAGVLVMPPKSHRHHDQCGHYFNRGRWYLLEDHHHQHGCGHHSVRGRWVLRDH